jgi:hypothetical protein
MKDGDILGTRRSKTTKVSHSLDESVDARLKQLAYSERVSESSIIELLLTEFFALGNDETLGRIIRDSALTLRRNQPPHMAGQLPLSKLLDELQHARNKLVRSFEAWHGQPGIEQLNAIGLARAELATILNQISRKNEERTGKEQSG